MIAVAPIATPGVVALTTLLAFVSTSTPPLVVNQPMSYLGLFTLLGDLINDNPFTASARPLAERLQTPETTPFVSENADVLVIRNAAGKYVMKSGNGEWIPYTY